MSSQSLGLFGALAAGVSRKSEPFTLADLPGFMLMQPVKSGQTVNYTTSLQVTTVLACCRVLANGVAQVPWRVMTAKAGGGVEAAPKHPLYPLINRRPNDFQTSFEFRQTLVLHLALTGNAFVFISRGAGDRILELIPLEPGRVTVTRNPDMTLSYRVASDGRTVVLTSREIWHVRGMSWNGWMGLEPVKLAREALGLSMALEEAHAKLHSNGVQPSGVYSIEGTLDTEGKDKLARWIKSRAAAGNRHEPLILDRGAKWVSQQMSGVDAEHLATRRFQIEETCRAMNVQPMMVFAVDKPTYASAEQLFTAHVVHTLMPIYELIEQSADVNLLGVTDDLGFYTHLEPRSLMRGSMKDQAEYFAKALGSGGSPAWMTQDEVRDDVDLNPKGGKAAELREPTNVASKAPATTTEGA